MIKWDNVSTPDKLRMLSDLALEICNEITDTTIRSNIQTIAGRLKENAIKLERYNKNIISSEGIKGSGSKENNNP